MVRLVAFVDADIRGNVGELGVVKTADARPIEALLGRNLIPVDEALVAAARTLVAQGIA